MATATVSNAPRVGPGSDPTGGAKTSIRCFIGRRSSDRYAKRGHGPVPGRVDDHPAARRQVTPVPAAFRWRHARHLSVEGGRARQLPRRKSERLMLPAVVSVNPIGQDRWLYDKHTVRHCPPRYDECEIEVRVGCSDHTNPGASESASRREPFAERCQTGLKSPGQPAGLGSEPSANCRVPEPSLRCLRGCPAWPWCCPHGQRSS